MRIYQTLSLGGRIAYIFNIFWFVCIWCQDGLFSHQLFFSYYFPFFSSIILFYLFFFIHLYFIHGFLLFFYLSSPIYSLVLFQFFSFLCCALYLFHNVDITIFKVCRSFVFLIIWKNNLFFHYLYIVCFEVSNVCLNVQLDFLIGKLYLVDKKE